MKKIHFFILSIVLMFTSCSDLLNVENPNAIPSDEYYSLESDVEKGVSGIYSAIRSNSCALAKQAIYMPKNARTIWGV